MKELKKNIGFNAKLYLDALRQLKVVGILCAVIMGISAFAFPMFYNIENINRMKNARLYSYEFTYITNTVLRMNPLIITIFLIITPLMVMYLFSFLNRRNACDFYHAIPVTRENLAISYCAAILTWNVGLVLESVMISMFAASIFTYVKMEWSGVLVMICSMTAAIVFMLGTFLISMSVTGTWLTNLCVAAMILVFPRALITFVVAAVTESINVLEFNLGNSILDDRLNVITNLVTGYMIRGRYEAWRNYSSVAYTLIVGVLLCVAGIILFKKRKSEAATQAAITPRLQAVLRMIPAMAISLIPVYFFYGGFVTKDEVFTEETIFLLVILYIIAIISIFMYELITTRKFRNIGRAVKSIGLLAIFNVVLLLIMVVFYQVLLNDVPSATKVKAVRIEGYRSTYNTSYYDDSIYGYNYYGDAVLRNTWLESDGVKELILSELERNIQCQKDGNYYLNGTMEYRGEEANLSSVWVMLDCGISKKLRVIYLTHDAADRLIELLGQEEKIHQAVYEVMDMENAKLAYSNEYDIEATKIIEAYRKDIAKFDFKKALFYSIGNVNDSYLHRNLTFERKDGRVCGLILSSETQETMKLYCDSINAKDSKEQNIVSEFVDYYQEAIQNIATKKDGYSEASGHFYIRVYDVSNRSEGNNYTDEVYQYGCSAYFNVYGDSNVEMEKNINKDFTENGLAVLTAIGEKLEKSGDAFDCTKPFIEVSSSLSNYEDNGGTLSPSSTVEYSRVHYYNVDEEMISFIRVFAGQTGYDYPMNYKYEEYGY